MELQVGLVAPSPGSSSGSSALSVLGSGSWKRPGRGDMVSALPGVTLTGFSLFPVLFPPPPDRLTLGALPP